MNAAPDGWKVIRFDDFTTLQRGKDLTKSQFKAGSTPVAGSNGVIGYHDESFVKAPGVTVGRSGSCGKVAFYAVDFWAHNTSLYVRDFHGNDARFAAYFLEFLDLSRFRTGASVPTLDRNSFKELLITVPGVDEQRRIARVLTTVHMAIEQQARLIALTQELKRALTKKLFTEGLHGERRKMTEIGLMPESWKVVELGSLARIGNGSTPKRDNRSYWEGGSLPWLTSGKIHERHIEQADEFVTETAIRECHLPRVKPNSVLIAITGQGKTLGNSALVTFETCVSQHLAYIQFHAGDVVPEFMLWYLQTRYEHLRSVSQAGGSTKGALTCGYIKTYPVPLPTADEQNEIAKMCATLDKKERNHERKKLVLEELFRTLLHQLMTAQIRVNDLDLPGLSSEGVAQ